VAIRKLAERRLPLKISIDNGLTFQELGYTMGVSDGVLDVVVVFLTVALCVSCTGTWFNWRRNV